MNTLLGQSSPRTGIIRVLLLIVLVLSLLLAASVKVMGAGWLLIMTCGVPYFLVLGLHTAAHFRPILSGPSAKPTLVALVVVSHLCLIGGMLLQMDYTDAPLPLLALTNITWHLFGWPPWTYGISYPAAPEWMARMGLFWNVFVLLPAVITWPFLFNKRLYFKNQTGAL